MENTEIISILVIVFFVLVGLGRRLNKKPTGTMETEQRERANQQQAEEEKDKQNINEICNQRFV